MKQQSEIISVAIADDHPLVQKGLQNVLAGSAMLQITDCYSNGKELLAGLKQRQPEVLLLDIQMPGQTGDELAGIVGELYPNIKIIALTNLDNIFYVKTMMRKGVLGYVLKTAREEILIDAIMTVCRGEKYIERSLREKMMDDHVASKKQLSASPILSRREKEILQLMASSLTSQEIADKLFLSKRTVENHRLNIMTKLGVHNAASLVSVAMKMGLVE